jgi:hypothetical protein
LINELLKTKRRTKMPREGIRYLNDCVLVVGGVQSSGCVSYSHTDRTEKLTGIVEEVDWRTHKTVDNVNEQKAMVTTRLNLERKITTLGAILSGFGWIIPASKSVELNNALKEIYAGVKAYNTTSTCTKLFAWMSIFDVRSNDERIAGALYEKAVDLLTEIESAIRNGDVKAIRTSLSAMRGLDTVLPTEKATQVSTLITNARAAVKQAVKAVKDAAGSDEAGARELLRLTLASANLGLSGIRASFVETAEEINQLAEETTEPAPERAIESAGEAEEG